MPDAKKDTRELLKGSKDIILDLLMFRREDILKPPIRFRVQVTSVIGEEQKYKKWLSERSEFPDSVEEEMRQLMGWIAHQDRHYLETPYVKADQSKISFGLVIFLLMKFEAALDVVFGASGKLGEGIEFLYDKESISLKKDLDFDVAQYQKYYNRMKKRKSRKLCDNLRIKNE